MEWDNSGEWRGYPGDSGEPDKWKDKFGLNAWWRDNPFGKPKRDSLESETAWYQGWCGELGLALADLIISMQQGDTEVLQEKFRAAAETLNRMRDDVLRGGPTKKDDDSSEAQMTDRAKLENIETIVTKIKSMEDVKDNPVAEQVLKQIDMILQWNTGTDTNGDKETN